MPSDQTGLAARCYSLSSAPHTGRHQITVKRTIDGYASNWICYYLRPGGRRGCSRPAGSSRLNTSTPTCSSSPAVRITPVISIARTALEKGTGKVVLFYANRERPR